MSNLHGTPIWYELVTTDADAAQAFYGDVVGWDIAPFPGQEANGYRILTGSDGQGAGGMLALPQNPMQPGWYGYIGVDDVDATAARITEHGGTVHMGPQDIPGVGRFAFATDPQGLPFYIMRGDSPEDSQAWQMNTPGHCGWNELITPDLDGALAFYRALFGWENKERMPMGPMGDYCFIDHGGHRIGAIMPAGETPPRSNYYFNVPSIAAAIGRVTAGGGSVTQGPHEVPGGMHIIQGTDPQGIAFALVGGK